MGNYVPPLKGGKVIGKPYQGTHGRSFNKKGGSDNWESENAVDIAVPIGTPVYAVEDGTIGKQFGLLGTGGRFAGQRLHLKGKGGEFYYAHLSAFSAGIHPGVKVKAGQLLGYTGEANGVAHLHFASTTNISPVNVVKGLTDTPEAAASLPGINAPADGSAVTSPTANDQGVVDPQLESQQSSAISSIPQVGGAPQFNTPLAGDQTDANVTPVQSGGSTWQLIASQGDVSPDTLRLANLASLSGNAG